jgi:hypothetical protein
LMVQWTWQDQGKGPHWVLTSPIPYGSKPVEPKFRGKHLGDTAQTPLQ